MLAEFNSGKVGYYHLPKNGEGLITAIKEWQKELTHIKCIVVIGVGGSSLGTKAVHEMLYYGKKNSDTKLLFLENLDPLHIDRVLTCLEFSKTLFLLVSKSGATLESVSIAKIVMARFEIKPTNKEFKNRFAVITDKNSVLHQFAKKYMLKVFFIPQNVGGRFSFLSACGLVPLTLCGFDAKELLMGANSCVDDFLQDDKNQILQKAYSYVIAKENINVLFSYSNSFENFNKWYVQLWAESLGKKNGENRVGLTPIGLIGSTDQHSFLQLIMEGPKDKSVTFIRVAKMENDIQIPDFSLKFLEAANLKNSINAGELLNEQSAATMKSVIEQGIKTDEIILDKLDAFHAGYLMYYFELLTSTCGIMLDINAYNQPGVEIGKKILLKKLGKNFD